MPHRPAERRQVDAHQRPRRAPRSRSRRASPRPRGTRSAASSPPSTASSSSSTPRACTSPARSSASGSTTSCARRCWRSTSSGSACPPTSGSVPVTSTSPPSSPSSSAARARRSSRSRRSRMPSTASASRSTSSPSTGSATGPTSCPARRRAETRWRTSPVCSSGHLPPSPGPLYPDGQLTDEPELVMIAELVREAALEGVRDELPHSLAVVVEEIVPREGRSEDNQLLDVRVNVFVERDSPEGHRHRPRRLAAARGRHERPPRHRGPARRAGAPRPPCQGGQGLAARPEAARAPRLLTPTP